MRPDSAGGWRYDMPADSPEVVLASLGALRAELGRRLEAAGVDPEVSPIPAIDDGCNGRTPELRAAVEALLRRYRRAARGYPPAA